MVKGIIFDFNRTLFNPDTAQLEEGAREVLDTLTSDGYKLCLISKKSKEDRETQITELGLDKYFLDIQIIEGNKKEEHIDRCMLAIGLPSSKIAVVGDRIKEEIQLGNRYGMVTIWYKAGKFAAELPESTLEQPTYIISKLEEMMKCLS